MVLLDSYNTVINYNMNKKYTLSNKFNSSIYCNNIQAPRNKNVTL